MKRPLRILRLIARLNIGGPAIQAVTLSSELPADKYQTMLVCGCLSSGEGDMTYLAHEKGVHPHVIKEFGRNLSLTHDVKSFFIIRKILKEFKPDILHTHTAKAGTLGRLAVLSRGIPFFSSGKIRMIHTFHGHTFHSYFNFFKTLIFILIEKFLARFTDKIIVVSEQQKKDICSTFKIANQKKVHIIRLGFDLSDFEKISSEHQTARNNRGHSKNPAPLRVGIVGRLTPIKNHLLLLEAVNCLKRSNRIKGFKFIVIGDGELRAELETEAENLNLRDFIVFRGWQKNMPAVYSELDVVVLTSKNEGTPVALIEAMAASIPVAASAVGGVPDLMGPIIEEKPGGFQIAQNGLTFPPGNAFALAQALLFLYENNDCLQQITRAAKDFATANYSLERLLNDIRKLYETDGRHTLLQ